MSDFWLARRIRRTEALIVAVATCVVVIGLLVRANAVPYALRPRFSLETRLPPVASLANLRVRHDDPLFALDVVSVDGRPFVANSVHEIPVKSGDTVSVSGWAADRVDGVPANTVFLAVGSEEPTALQYGAERPDVATSLGNPKLLKTGFSGALDTSRLQSGDFPLRFFVVAGSGRAYGEIPITVSLTVK